MTSKISLFNLGIYKNIIKRMKWGSILYFVVLFFAVPFVLMVDNLERLAERYAVTGTSSVIFGGDYLIIPVLMALAVPTVVGALVFRYLHSGKQSIFVHGLPTTRLQNYVSTLLAAFTLMAAPVVVNGIILGVMALGRFDQILQIGHIFQWVMLNLSILFIMFGVSSFTAFLTGNTAAHIGINVFLHIVPMLVALTIELISSRFLYGFIQGDSFIASEILNYTPAVWLVSNSLGLYRQDLYIFRDVAIWAYLVGALLFYVIGFVLYKKRKAEAAGDVAAFRVFRPILKYMVTTAVGIGIFAIVLSMNISALSMFVVAIVMTAIAYFACEMLMNKSFRVFGLYKGYLGFVAVCSLFIAFFAYTNVFGYETRIPKGEDVEGAAIYVSYSGEKPVIADADAIENVRAVHKSAISNIPVTEDELQNGQNRYIRVSYKLKNGKWLDRRYLVSDEFHTMALSKMYQNKEYKLIVSGINDLNIENIKNFNLGFKTKSSGHYIAVNQDAVDIMNAVKKDVEELSYIEMKKVTNPLGISIDIDCTALENRTLRIFKNVDGDRQYNDYAYLSFSIEINSNFKNTLKVIKERGYYQEAISNIGSAVWICKEPVNSAEGLINYKEDNGKYEEFRVSLSDCVKLSHEDGKALAELMANRVKEDNLPEGKSYLVFCYSGDSDNTMWIGSECDHFSESDMPDFLKKYIQ